MEKTNQQQKLIMQKEKIMLLYENLIEQITIPPMLQALLTPYQASVRQFIDNCEDIDSIIEKIRECIDWLSIDE